MPITTPYYQLRDELDIRGRWHLGQALTDCGIEPSFIDGTLIDHHHYAVSEEVPAIVCSEYLNVSVTTTGKILDFSLSAWAVPIVSKNLGCVIEDVARGDVQLVPLRIEGAGDFVALNVVRIVRCIDETRSEFLKWTKDDHRSDLAGQYRQVTEMVLDTSSIPSDVHLFRVDGWTVAMVASRSLREAMIKAGCHGAKFIRLPD